MRCLCIAVQVCCLVTAANFALGFTSSKANEPSIIFWEADHLNATKQLLDSPPPSVAKALRNLRRAANEALNRGPYSVVQKNELPPSGDKHDYLSFSRYWWPNPDTEDGLPYIRRDGRTNVALRSRGDRDRIGQLFIDVEALTLANHFFNEKKYAEHATRLIRTWFLDAETAMNPNLNYGQAVPGRSEGRGVGIIDTRGFITVLDCVALLQQSDCFPEADTQRLRQWFNEFLVWLRTNKLGKEEQNAKNNHGSWYAAQVSRIAIFVGDTKLAREIVEQTRDQRIPDQFAVNGSQQYENERTKSLHYCFFNLSALSVVARVAEHLNIELWDAPATKTGNMRRGLEYVVPYLTKQGEWPHQQIDEFTLSPKTIQLLRQASTRYKDPRFTTAIKQVRHRHRSNNYASLVCASLKDKSKQNAPNTTILEDAQSKQERYELPDISQYTVESIANRLPTDQNGRVSVEPSKNYGLLDEAFRGKRGDDLRRRQGTDDTRVICVHEEAVTISQLVEQIADESIATSHDSIVTIRLPILVQPGATLVINGSETTEVRLSTDRGVFLANAGTLLVLRSKVTSWSDQQSEPTSYSKDLTFRPFISSYIRSKTYLAGSQFEHLGYMAPTAYGLSLSSHPERNRGRSSESWPTGQIVECTFLGLFYGFYSFEARDVAIVSCTYDQSIRYGIDPHDRSKRLIIANNVAKRTIERHGIIGSREINDSFIFGNWSYENHQSGIMLDRQCSNNVVADNQVFNNGQGIAIYESDSNLVTHNVIVANKSSGIRIRNSADTHVQENTVVGNGDYAFEVYSKTLDDHGKRVARGDHYDAYVEASVHRNYVTCNLGFAKGNRVQSLSLSEIISNVNNEAVTQLVGNVFDRHTSKHDHQFGSELKPHAAELRKAFGRNSPVVHYEGVE